MTKDNQLVMKYMQEQETVHEADRCSTAGELNSNISTRVQIKTHMAFIKMQFIKKATHFFCRLKSKMVLNWNRKYLIHKVMALQFFSVANILLSNL